MSGQPFPVLGYRVERWYANGAKVRPLPCKSFTAAEVNAIAGWFVQEGWQVQVRTPNAVGALNYAGLTACDVPEPYTRAQAKRDEASRRALELAASRKEAQAQGMATSTAGGFVKSVFGDSLNGYNSLALAKYLDGSVPRFEGLISHRAADVLVALGINTEDSSAALLTLKASFEQLRAAERSHSQCN